MIASLPMYDMADCQAANDRYWALIRDGLRAAGMAAPDVLARDLPDFMGHWLRGDLVLSQTCGFPFRAKLHGKVTLVGTPDFGLDHCPPGYYQSVFVVRADDRRDGLAAFRDARFGYNDPMSQSGWAAAQNHAAALGFRFTPAVHTGGHALSARAVLEGRADIAAIDAVSWRLLQRNFPDMAGLSVAGRTDPTPGLPYIAALGADRAAAFEAISAAVKALSDTDRLALGIKGIVHISAADYLAVPTPAPPDLVMQH